MASCRMHGCGLCIERSVIGIYFAIVSVEEGDAVYDIKSRIIMPVTPVLSDQI
jgi:hypothetical protein